MNKAIKNKPAALLGICITMLFLSGNITSYAQNTKHLSLQEAVERGLANSKKLQASLAAVDAASAQTAQMKMQQLPDLNISGSYLRVSQPTIDLQIPLGTSDSSGGSGTGAASSLKVNQMMYGMANATWPVFAGFKIHNSIAAAQYLQKAAELDADRDKTAVVRNIIDAYYNLYKADAALRLVQENLVQAKSRVADLQNMEQNGLLARNDLLKAELQQSNVELTLAEAENNSRIGQFNMNLLLGLEEQTALTLDSVGAVPLPELNSLEEWEQQALSHRGDYLALAQRQMAAEKNIRVEKGAYYPAVALTGGYMAGKIPDLVTLSNALNAGVGLSYNLAAFYKTGPKIKAAKAQQQQLQWTAQQLNDAIRIQVYKAYQDYLEAMQKIRVYKKAAEQADENYRITKNKFDNALETTTNLLDADVAQLQAHLHYEFSRVDAVLAYHKLFETAGMTAMSFQ